VGAVTPLLTCTTVGNACLRGAGDTRTGMKVMVLMNAVNFGLTWLLSSRLERLERRPLVAIDGEQAIEVGGAENL
jgi:hypothetical protein